MIHACNPSQSDDVFKLDKEDIFFLQIIENDTTYNDKQQTRLNKIREKYIKFLKRKQINDTIRSLTNINGGPRG
jgi:hypothetical protein